ncbi:ATP-binding cassette, subfamily C, exporter for protease/lipase [Pseudomonas agarici]|nr:ATP-binding cassette, subfamily C, exporter for protease/lipase [Pseudomonas agarici]
MRLLLDPRHDIDVALLSYRRVFWSLGLFSGAINMLVLVPSLYMMQVYDRVLTSRNETTLFMLTLIALGLFMVSALIEWVRGQVMIRMSAGIDEALGERLFDAAFARGLREHNANPAQVLGDLATLRQLIAGQGLIALLDAPWLPIFLLIAFIFHPWFGVLTLLLALVLVGLALWGELATRACLGEANRLSVQSAAYVNSTLQNAEVI